MLDLDLYTDPGVMRAALAPYAAADRVQVLQATRRAPRRNAASRACRIAVCYRLQTLGRPDEIVYGKVYPQEVCAEQVADTQDSPTWLREIGMLLWRLPRDPGLPQLAALLDGHTELVRYRPEERATLRRGSRYAKTFHGAEGAELFERFSHFGKSSEAFEVAAPIGYDAATRTFWQEGVDATALADIVTAQNCTEVMARVAQTLATLHATGPRFGPRRSNAALAAAALKRGVKIGRCMPELDTAARRVADAIAADVPPGSDAVQIHGDFHLDQLVSSPSGPVLVDLDSMVRGAAEIDLAEFLVDLALRGLPPGVTRDVAGRLLSSYREAAGSDLDGALLGLCADAEFVNRCYRHLRRYGTGWQRRLEAELSRRPAVRAVSHLAG